MSKSPSDIDDLFGSAAQQPMDKPVFAPAAKDSRKEVRVKVKWLARVQLPNGNVVEMRVSDISESGIGLAGEVGIPPNSVLTCAVAVPDLDDPKRVTAIVGSIKTTHCTVKGLDLTYGGTWVRSDATGQDLIRKWIRQLRR